jgi:nitrate reductase NapE component
LSKEECQELIDKDQGKISFSYFFYEIQCFYFIFQFLFILSTFSFYVDGFSKWDQFTNFYGVIINGPFLIIASMISSVGFDNMNRSYQQGELDIENKDSLIENQKIFFVHTDLNQEQNLLSSAIVIDDNNNNPTNENDQNQKVTISFGRENNNDLTTNETTNRTSRLKEGIFLSYIHNENQPTTAIRKLMVSVDGRVESVDWRRVFNTQNIHFVKLIQYYRIKEQKKIPQTLTCLLICIAFCILPVCSSHIVAGYILYLWCFILIVVALLIVFVGVIPICFYIPFDLTLSLYLFLRKRITLETSEEMQLIDRFYKIIIFRFLVSLFMKISFLFLFLFSMQISFNYASLYYNGYSYLDVIYEEFLLRSQLNCFLSHSFENVQHSLSFFNWL